MGKRLPKIELLQEVNTEGDALDRLLRQIKPDMLTRRGVTPGGWSEKDILAHVLGWQQHLLKWHATELRGRKPAVPAPGMTWRDLKRFNEMIYQQHCRRSLGAVLRDYETWHRRMIKLIQVTKETDLLTVGRYKWMGPTWSLSDYCRAETASHYRWARKWIRRWLARQKSRAPMSGDRKCA